MELSSHESQLVSVIMPCHNGEHWLRASLDSVAAQTYRPIELSFWDDSSTDTSAKVLQDALPDLIATGIQVVCGGTAFGGGGAESGPLGCGAAKNRAISQSNGTYLCFCDADDVMHTDRVTAQLEVALHRGKRCLVGSNVERQPQGAQPRYTSWLNSLSDAQLFLQRFRECTLAMPTWFCARDVLDEVGGFVETGPGAPEDLDFFYRFTRQDCELATVRKPLVMYRYHEHQQSRGVDADVIWSLRVKELESQLLCCLSSFSIWSAGRDGKRLYRSLSLENRNKVVAFLDVDQKKLAAGLYFDRDRRQHVPIVEWKRAIDFKYQPTIICVKSGLHEGFEENLASLQLTEGEQYWHFN